MDRGTTCPLRRLVYREAVASASYHRARRGLPVRNWIIAALTAALAISIVTGAIASDRTGTVTVRVWENTSDGQLWISAIKDGQEHRPYRLDLDAGTVANSAGDQFVYGDITFTGLVERVDVDRCSPVDRAALINAVFQVSFRVGSRTYTGTAYHLNNGAFVTAGHVVDVPGRPTYITLRNQEHELKAAVLGMVAWAEGDLAILRGRTPPPLPNIAQSGGGDGYFPGGIVTAAGYPQGHTALVARIWNNLTFADAALYEQGSLYVTASESSYWLSTGTKPGSSGSPVLDACGQLEGMIVAGNQDYTLSRFIDIDTILASYWEALQQVE